MNQMKTLILLAALTALLLWLGQLVGGQQGMVIALVMALVMNFGSYWFSDTGWAPYIERTILSENQ